MLTRPLFCSGLTLAVCSPALLFPVSARAQNAPAAPAPIVDAQQDFAARLARAQKDLDAKREELHVPGAALVIVKDDKIIAIRGMGLRDVERKLPVTPNTMFAIGSSTKAFTAMTALMSVDDGKLSLSDPPRKYLPYFKLQDPDANARITVSDLLCHRSGLERTDLAWYTGKLRPAEVIQVAGEARPTAKLGEKFQYQNVMFLAAGEVVASAQGEPWGEVVRDRIFRPLGMKDTTLSVRAMQARKDFSRGYGYNSNTKATRLLPTRDLNVIAPAGAINSNAQDMAQWLRLMLAGGAFEGKRLVSEASFAQLLTKHMDVGGAVGYSYGWFLRDWHGHKVVEHGGNIDGFSAEVALMPDQKLGFVLLTNLNATPLQNLSLDIVWDDLLGTPPAAPASADVVVAPALPASDPTREVGVYALTPKMDFTVTLNNGRLMAQPTGQANLPLKNLGGRRYAVDVPGASGIYFNFRPVKDAPNTTEILFEQGGASMVAKAKAPAAAFVPPLSVDDLMAKTIAAVGGETALRAHKSMQTRITLDMPAQGIVGEGVIYTRAPFQTAQRITLRAAGKKIATLREYFDGAQGGSENSFALPTQLAGGEIDDTRAASDYYRELNWKTAYKTVVIKAMGKLGDEDVYVVEKTPIKGNAVVERYSTKTYLLLQRETSKLNTDLGIALTTVATYSDYRPVGGLMIPFKVVEAAQGSETTTLVKDVTFDAPMPDSLFRGEGKKQRAAKAGL